MRNSLLFFKLTLCLLLFSQLANSQIDVDYFQVTQSGEISIEVESSFGEAEEGGEEGGFETGEFGEESFIVLVSLLIVNDSVPLVEDISYLGYAIQFNENHAVQYFYPTDSSISYAVIDENGNAETYPFLEEGVNLDISGQDEEELNNGNFLLVGSNSTGIYGSQIDSDGNLVSSSYLITEIENSELTAVPYIYVFEDGKVLLLTNELTENSTEEEYWFNLYAMILDEDGSTVIMDKTLIAEDPVQAPAGSIDLGGNVLPILWQGTDGKGYRRNIESSGNFEDVEEIASFEIENVSDAIAIPDSNDFILIYQKQSDDSGYDTYATTLRDDDAEGVEEGEQLTASFDNEDFSIKSLLLPDGNIFTTWLDQPEDPNDWTVRGEIIDQDFNVVVPEFIINNPDRVPVDYLTLNDVFIFNEEYLFVTWRYNCTDEEGGTGIGSNVLVLKFDGRRLFTFDLFNDCQPTRGSAEIIEFPPEHISAYWRDPVDGTSSNSTFYEKIIRVNVTEMS